MKYEYTFTDGKKLPIKTIYCVGKNYSKHAKEMGGEVPNEPLIFIKPVTAFIPDGGTILLPTFSQMVHHEVELVVVIGESAKDITPEDANNVIAGFGIGIDVTLRDLQNKAKKSGEPWAVAKGFATSAPISDIVPFNLINDNYKYFDIELYINGVLKQKANTSEMERSYLDLISYISNVFTLQSGDCIFTGTPDGVGKIDAGDEIKAILKDYVSLSVKVEKK
jgi:2-keto-4-pentenoate hydratase/2-oxohepta-3-ene-1,7-dioic acid hydratase in catechol pathway